MEDLMQITLTPMRHPETMELERYGDTLTINGEPLDLSPLPDGATLPRSAVACDWLAGDIDRIDGVLHLTLILPHGPDAPDETRFPLPLVVTGDGPVALPAYDAAPPADDITVEDSPDAD